MVGGYGGSHRRQGNPRHTWSHGLQSITLWEVIASSQRRLVFRQWGARRGVYVRRDGLIFTWGDRVGQQAAGCPVCHLKKDSGKAA